MTKDTTTKTPTVESFSLSEGWIEVTPSSDKPTDNATIHAALAERKAGMA